MALPSLLPRQYRNDSIPKVAFHLLKSVGLLGVRGHLLWDRLSGNQQKGNPGGGRPGKEDLVFFSRQGQEGLAVQWL